MVHGGPGKGSPCGFGYEEGAPLTEPPACPVTLRVALARWFRKADQVPAGSQEWPEGHRRQPHGGHCTDASVPPDSPENCGNVTRSTRNSDNFLLPKARACATRVVRGPSRPNEEETSAHSPAVATRGTRATRRGQRLGTSMLVAGRTWWQSRDMPLNTHETGGAATPGLRPPTRSKT